MQSSLMLPEPTTPPSSLSSVHMSMASAGQSQGHSIDPEVEQPTAGVGLSSPQLSQSRRKMLDLVNRLHSTGVQADIDLPQIVVIGSQSSGKSSLIESISGITLPRAAGTYTRCPTECRLSHSEAPWKCVVSLHYTTDAGGTPLVQTRREQFGPTIYDKSEVEDRIRRAQCAVLNPAKPAACFLEGDDEPSDVGLGFSKNCVSLQISGPDVADLSFCDLPGLIANVGLDDNTNDIKLVEGIVTSYTRKSNCVTLLTVACGETGFENQRAYKIARVKSLKGKRTIGVLTKPDRIPVGEESNWLRFIKNQKVPLAKNWYCVKQPSSDDLKHKWTWQEAREKENEFFALTTPWCDLDGLYKKYLGTSNLVEHLSATLSDLVARRLPEIRDELEKSIIKSRELLGQLPSPREPSQQPTKEVTTLLPEFIADLTRHISGIPDENGLIQSIRPAQERFRREIRLTVPKFLPYEKKFAGTKEMPRAEFLDHEDAEVSDCGNEDTNTWSSSGPVFHFKLEKPVTTNGIYVDEVFERAQKARTREFPGNYPFVVQQSYIDDFVKRWRSPAQTLCKNVYKILLERLNVIVNQRFTKFGRGILEQRVRTLMQDHLKSCLARAEERISWLADLEDKAFTLNTYYLADYKSKFLAYYRDARRKDNHAGVMATIGSYTPTPPSVTNSKQSATYQSGISKVLSGLMEIGFTGVGAHDLVKLLKTDEMEPALEIMADVRAYFQVAFKRFTDSVPMAIDRELVRGVERGIFPLVWNGLGLNSLDAHRICTEFAQEDPAIGNRRSELVQKLQRMEEAFQLLHVGGT